MHYMYVMYINVVDVFTLLLRAFISLKKVSDTLVFNLISGYDLNISSCLPSDPVFINM